MIIISGIDYWEESMIYILQNWRRSSRMLVKEFNFIAHERRWVIFEIVFGMIHE
jgi:hypothetical protein